MGHAGPRPFTSVNFLDEVARGLRPPAGANESAFAMQTIDAREEADSRERRCSKVRELSLDSPVRFRMFVSKGGGEIADENVKIAI